MKKPLPQFYVRVGALLVQGFAYPPKGHDAPEDEREARRISSGCWALLGDRRPFTWVDERQARGVANRIEGATVERV